MPRLNNSWNSWSLRAALLAGLCVFASGLATCDDPPPANSVRLYHPDSRHVWNRLHHELFVRRDGVGHEFGHDQLDVLLWPDTSRHLLDGESHIRARDVLREFVEDSSSASVTQAVARATLQRDLWAAFDWAADLNALFAPAESAPARRELRDLLQRAIRRVALSREAIAALPDTFRAAVEAHAFPTQFDPANPGPPFLPPELFDATGPWVCVGEKTTSQGDPHAQLVPRHVEGLSRSIFMVFLRLPDGRDATREYLKRLAEFPQPWVLDGSRVQLNPALPEFPPGTQMALVRLAMLVDDQGRLTPTRLAESIQIRTYTPEAAARAAPGRASRRAGQAVQEFVLSPIRLLAGDPVALRPVGHDERGFEQFLSLSDPFESHARQGERSINRLLVHESCFGCHSQPGVHGFNTYTRNFGPQLTAVPQLVETTPTAREQATIFWKQTRADWGLLRGSWANASRIVH